MNTCLLFNHSVLFILMKVDIYKHHLVILIQTSIDNPVL